MPDRLVLQGQLRWPKRPWLFTPPSEKRKLGISPRTVLATAHRNLMLTLKKIQCIVSLALRKRRRNIFLVDLGSSHHMSDQIPVTEVHTGTTSSPLDQLQSPLFGKLPAELRAAIYTEIFGGQRIHLKFTTHPIRADRVGLRKRWRHAICEQSTTVSFREVTSRQHHCFLASRRRVLDINFLFTCQRALEEGIPILYQSNTFHIVNVGTERLPSDDLRSLQVKIPKNWGLVRSLEFKWEVNIFDRNHPRFVPHHWGRDGYEAFWDGLADMPSLSQLRISIIMPQILMLTSPSELQKLYFEPIKRLKHLRTCEVILPISYSSHFGMSPEDQHLPIDGDGDYRVSWATVDDGRPLAAEATTSASLQHLRALAPPSQIQNPA